MKVLLTLVNGVVHFDATEPVTIVFADIDAIEEMLDDGEDMKECVNVIEITEPTDRLSDSFLTTMNGIEVTTSDKEFTKNATTDMINVIKSVDDGTYKKTNT